MNDLLNLSAEELEALPPKVRQILHQKTLELLRDLGVTPLVGPDGQLGVDLAQLAPALGLTMAEAQAPLDEAGMQGAVRTDMRPLQ